MTEARVKKKREVAVMVEGRKRHQVPVTRSPSIATDVLWFIMSIEYSNIYIQSLKSISPPIFRTRTRTHLINK